tara:strand:+ start:691 stop:1086 length:396 start_codon:yes stop_codon:yes gene_type:complete
MFKNTIESAIELQKNRSNRDQLVKNKILNMIKDKIINYTKYNFTNCIFNIPHFIIGYLPYDNEKMCNFIIKILKNDGLLVVKLNCENIYISWHIDDLHKNQLNLISSKKEKIKNEENNKNNILQFANKNKL